jgi:predicted enzyme related to lactoylglutathione lyase
MSTPQHVVSWFEIPVVDFARAKRFYEAVLGLNIEPMSMGTTTMGFLSGDQNAVGGALVQGDGNAPTKQGTIVYLNGGEDLAPMLARAQQAGGSIALPKTDIGDSMGCFAHFIDTEGNKVGIYSLR